jgi:putative peptidoglycan lipid II flippase
MGPRVLGLATVQVVWFVTVRLASPLAAGSLAAFQFAWALAQMPQTLLGTAVGVVAFPTMADMAARGQRAALRATIHAALRAMLAASVPAAVALYMLAGPAVHLVLVTGAFSTEAANATIGALRMLAIGLVAHVILELLARAFYAIQDTVRPLYFAGIAMVLNVGLATWLVGSLGIAGVALANSVAVTVEILIAYEVLRRRLGGAHTRRLLGGVVRIVAASLAMAAVIWALTASPEVPRRIAAVLQSMPVTPSEPSPMLTGLIHLGVVSAVGAAAYVTVAWLLGLEEMRELIRVLVARLTFVRQRL